MNANVAAAYRPSRRWEHDTAMLASSMMLVSISEDSTADQIGFKSRLCPSSNTSRIGSGSSLSGWGTATTRKSFKMDLCALAPSEEPSKMQVDQHQPHEAKNCDDQEWGIVF